MLRKFDHGPNYGVMSPKVSAFVFLPSCRGLTIYFNLSFKGVATQCVKVDKLARANNQYGNNVALK